MEGFLMKIELEYKDGRPNFEVSTKRVTGWDEPIIEVKVEGNSGRARKEALADVMVNLEYLLRDLKNMHDSDIKSMRISNSVLGTYKKSETNVDYYAESMGVPAISKYDRIIYSFYSDVFAEKLLFTRGDNAVSRNGGNLSFGGTPINESLLSLNTRSQKKEFIDSLIISVRTFLPDYEIRVNPKTRKLTYAYKGVIINDIEDIVDDDVFLYFKFVEVLLTKGAHYGLFFIDASLFSANVLSALIAFINLNFMNQRLVFIYNVPSAMRSKLNRIPRDTIVFPNHKIKYEDVKNKK